MEDAITWRSWLAFTALRRSYQPLAMLGYLVQACVGKKENLSLGYRVPERGTSSGTNKHGNKGLADNGMATVHGFTRVHGHVSISTVTPHSNVAARH